MRQKTNNPAEVFKIFLTDRRSGDLETVKSTLSAATLRTVENVVESEKVSFDEALNSVARFYGQHYGERLPKTQNEKIGGDVACVEVENFSTGKFDNFVFLKENGVWKLALDLEVMAVIEDKNILEKFFDYLRTVFSNLFENVKTKS
jgi:hypothetical protein